MRRLDGLEIKPGATLELKPLSAHLMLIGETASQRGRQLQGEAPLQERLARSRGVRSQDCRSGEPAHQRPNVTL
jgi:hypothetical protein